MVTANSALRAAELLQEEQQRRQETLTVNGAILATAREMQNISDRLSKIEQQQQEETRLNKQRDSVNTQNQKKNLFYTRVAAGAGVITIILTIIGLFMKQ